MSDQNETIHMSEVPVSSLYSHPLAKAFLSKVYAWMAVSMLVTAAVAVYCTRSVGMMEWVMAHPLMLCLGSVGIVLVMVLFHGVLTSGALSVLLMLYAAAAGMLFGPLLEVYTQESLGLTFGCTAGTFAVMSVYGMFTKRDLSPWGRAMIMGLIGLIIASIVNCFWGNGTFDLVISIAGVIIFTVLTAYDTQKILREGLVLEGSERSKGAVLGALSLYLDFLNLFLYLLRFLGDRK